MDVYLTDLLYCIARFLSSVVGNKAIKGTKIEFCSQQVRGIYASISRTIPNVTTFQWKVKRSDRAIFFFNCRTYELICSPGSQCPCVDT